MIQEEEQKAALDAEQQLHSEREQIEEVEPREESKERVASQDDLSKKFEAILSNSGAILHNQSDYEDQEQRLGGGQPDQIISEDDTVADLFGNHSSNNINRGGQKTRNRARD